MTDAGRKPALEIRNGTAEPIEVNIEVNPTRYVLSPGQEMKVYPDLEGLPVTLVVHTSGVTVYTGNDSDPLVTIDAEPAVPDWSTKS